MKHNMKQAARRSSFSIHGLGDDAEKLIKKRAESERSSVNKVMKELLWDALGLGKAKNDHREEFLDIFGLWTETDEKVFIDAIRDLETVNPEDWR